MVTNKVSSKDFNRRYYLHRRIRSRGIVVHSYKRIIELDGPTIQRMYWDHKMYYDQLHKYFSELRDKYNYSIQSVIMKANNKTDDPTVKQDVIEQGEPLVKLDVIEKQFSSSKKQIQKFADYSVDLVIETDEQLSVAENNSGLINDLLKGIEKLRKEIKDPYYQTSKMIDEFAKTLIEPLTEVKNDINGSIANYKRIQQAAARQKAEQIRKDTEKLADEMANEADRIHRIETQLIARLYGGFWINKEGQRKTSAGCVKYSDCDAIKSAVKDRIPKDEEFIHAIADYKAMKKRMLKRISEHKSNMIELESDSKTIKENAEKKIEKAKMNAGLEVTADKEEKTQEIIKKASKDIKSAQKEAKEAGKGVRKNLHFKMIDPESVPIEWLSLDEKAVREWAMENKDKIKEMLEKGENVVKGIKFWIEDAYVSR